MKFKQFVLLPSFQTNCYLLWDEESLEAALIDPAAKSYKIMDYIVTNGLKLKYLLNTHGHGDHIGGNRFFKESFPEVQLGIHSEDADHLLKPDLNLSLFFEEPTISPATDFFLEENVKLFLGNSEITVIHTPGHTRGGVSLYCKPFLFSGDTLFAEDIGRTDFPGGSFNTLIGSIKDKLFLLPDDTKVLPGHGESTTIEWEKKHNANVGEV